MQLNSMKALYMQVTTILWQLPNIKNNWLKQRGNWQLDSIARDFVYFVPEAANGRFELVNLQLKFLTLLFLIVNYNLSYLLECALYLLFITLIIIPAKR